MSTFIVKLPKRSDINHCLGVGCKTELVDGYRMRFCPACREKRARQESDRTTREWKARQAVTGRRWEI